MGMITFGSFRALHESIRSSGRILLTEDPPSPFPCTRASTVPGKFLAVVIFHRKIIFFHLWAVALLLLPVFYLTRLGFKSRCGALIICHLSSPT